MSDFREKEMGGEKHTRKPVVIKQFKMKKKLMYKPRGVFRTLYRNKFM